MTPRIHLAAICLALIGLHSTASAQKHEHVRQFECTEMLFRSGWFKDMDENLKRMLAENDPQPVVIIHKQNANAVEDRRTIAILPITERNDADPLASKKITGYKLRIAGPAPGSKPISKEFKGEGGKWLEDLWLNASGLAVFASYGSDEAEIEEGLVDGNEYHVFTTLRQDDPEVFWLSRHMMFFLGNSKAGSKRQAMEANIEALLKRMPLAEEARR